MINPKHLYNVTIDIKSYTETADSYGGVTRTYNTIYENELCRINWTKGDYIVLNDKLKKIKDGKVYLDYHSDIEVGYIFTYNSQDYEIISANRPDETANYMILEFKRFLA